MAKVTPYRLAGTCWTTGGVCPADADRYNQTGVTSFCGITPVRLSLRPPSVSVPPRLHTEKMRGKINRCRLKEKR